LRQNERLNHSVVGTALTSRLTKSTYVAHDEEHSGPEKTKLLHPPRP
jgi:hypothetical protein